MLAASSGRYSAAPSGMLTTRILNLCLLINKLQDHLEQSRLSVWGSEYLDQYSDHVCRGGPNVHILRDRMLSEADDSLSQLDWVRRELSDNPSTRRAILVFWNPATDFRSSEPPGMIYCHFIREGKTLHLSVYLRSNDAWNSAYPDMIAFSRLLRQEATRLRLTPGNYSHVVGDYHIYQHDLAYVRMRLGEK